MKKQKTLIFSMIAIVVSLVGLELLARGAFILFGRWDSWGYPDYVYIQQPYIGYAYDPKNENNVDQYGFTLDSNDSRDRNLNHKDSCEFRIFMLGGSTVLGRHLNDQDDTLPARIERLLNEQFDNGVTVSVINAGKPAFISVQTLLEHALYIKYSLNPDYVIHFDGSNDSVAQPKYWPLQRYRGVEDNIHRYHEDFLSRTNELTSLKGSLNALLRNLADYSAFMFVMHKTLNDPKAWIRQIEDTDVLVSTTDAEKGEQIAVLDWVEKHVSRYIFNVDLATRLGDLKTGVAYFLQPTMLPYMEPVLTDREMDFLAPGNYATEFHGYPKKDSKQMYYFRVRQEFDRLIGENRSPYVTIADLSTLFDDKPKDVAYFGDYVHYLSSGREIIAPEITRIISPNIQSQIKRDVRFQKCGPTES